MMGEESVAQIFLGAVVCVLWLSLLIYMQPYASVWDNIIAIVLGLHLALTLMAGMAIKLYDSTPGQDEYQRRGFGWVLTAVTIFCVTLSTISTLVGTPLVQSIYKAWKKRQEIHKLRKMQKKRSKRKSKRSSKKEIELFSDANVNAKKEIELFSDANVNPLYKGSADGKQTHSTRIAII